MTIVIVSILIVTHEFGHFITKALGVRVNEFAVGFRTQAFSKQGKETKYSVNLMPLGGYCAMEDEDEKAATSALFKIKSRGGALL